jgi:hypothetical protein
MRGFRYIVFSCILGLSAFSLVTYTACKKDKCKDTVCQNGGSCYQGVCTCPTQYTGTYCETDLCKGVSCMNGGMCVGGRCICINSFEGEHCETLNKYVGSYFAKDVCNNGANTRIYGVSISINPAGNPVLTIEGVAYNGSKIIAGPINTNSFSFSGTTYEGFFFEGTGVYSNDTIQVGYKVTQGGSAYTCTGVWVKE